MNDKAGLAANQDYGKDELSAEKLLTRHTALQTAVDTYSPIIQGLGEQARKLVQGGHFAAEKIASRQVNAFVMEKLFVMSTRRYWKLDIDTSHLGLSSYKGKSHNAITKFAFISLRFSVT